MDINVAKAFSEDLILHLTRKMRIEWIPKISSLEPRRTSNSQFQVKIGDVVFHLLKFHWRFPEIFMLELSSIEEVDGCLFNKFFRFGHDMFNFLDYCGQLLCVSLLLHFNGLYSMDSVLDFCASAIAANMVHFVNSGEVSYNDFWNKLQMTAEKINCQKHHSSEPVNVYDWHALAGPRL